MSIPLTANGRKVGRPRKWESVEELEAGIDAYFAECQGREKPPTITGLALHLGTNLQTLLDYQGVNPDRPEFADPAFADAIKRAKTRCALPLEERLAEGQGHPAGAIFLLKNHGFRDTQDVAHTHSLVVLGQPGNTLEPPAIEADVIGEIPALSPVENDRAGEGVRNR